MPQGVAGNREHFDVVSNTRIFLDAYARGDRQQVLSMIDPAVTAYGSDLDEVFKGRDGVEKMLRDDAQLWNGAAAIGEMQQISTFQDGDVASIFFNAPFRLGKQEPVVVRFAIVWHRSVKG
ncbi:MAG TPA: nuclear transport factor 2 family protein, partial [Candidatus Sulfotelmatobacter sp.]|nr:nuclear transport factor 2 family protein [Candidatus Sulfotelmatobacter sp.]